MEEIRTKKLKQIYLVFSNRTKWSISTPDQHKSDTACDMVRSAR